MNKLFILLSGVLLLTGISGGFLLLTHKGNQNASFGSPTPVSTTPLAVSLIPPASNSNAAKYNVDSYFSITYPQGWNEHTSACQVASNTFVAFLGILRQLSNGTAKIDICVYPITSASGNTYTFRSMKARTGMGETQDQFETHTINKIINDNKAYVTENTIDLRNSDTPGTSVYTKDLEIIHGDYLYSVSLGLSLNDRSEDINAAKQMIMPDVNQIVNSLTFRK